MIKCSEIAAMMRTWANTSAPRETRHIPKMKMKDLRRFVDKIDFSRDCYYWTGRRLQSGYGIFTIGGKHYYAHRVAWAVAHGRDVPPGKMVTHTCHCPSCIRPEHLKTATPKQNSKDMVAAGRKPYYRSHGKLNGPQVRQIRQLRQEGMTCREIGEKFGIDGSTASLVSRGLRYRDIPD